MGRIKGRLRRLEERDSTSPTEPEGGARQEGLRWLTTEELDAYEAALIRHEAGEAPHRCGPGYRGPGASPIRGGAR